MRILKYSIAGLLVLALSGGAVLANQKPAADPVTAIMREQMERLEMLAKMRDALVCLGQHDIACGRASLSVAARLAVEYPDDALVTMARDLVARHASDLERITALKVDLIRARREAEAARELLRRAEAQARFSVVSRGTSTIGIVCGDGTRITLNKPGNTPEDNFRSEAVAACLEDFYLP